MGASKVWPPYIEVIEDIPFETETRKNTSQWNDYKNVLVEGVPGKRKVYKKQDGTVVKTEILQEPVKEIVEVGTKNPNRSEIKYETEWIPYKTRTVSARAWRYVGGNRLGCYFTGIEDPVYEDESLTQPKGEYGEKELKYEYTYYKDQYKSRRLLSERIIKDPVDEVVYVCERDY